MLGSIMGDCGICESHDENFKLDTLILKIPSPPLPPTLVIPLIAFFYFQWDYWHILL